MRTASLALLALLAPSLAAQQDRIVWTDGSVTSQIRVEAFTWRDAKFRERGREESRPADTVVSMEVEKVKETYRRGFGGATDDDKYNAFLGEARKLVDTKPFLAQFGYYHAARLQMKYNPNEAFAVLEEMVTKLPDCGFYAEVFRFKLDYYLPMGKKQARNALAVAKMYGDTALQKGWPDGFVHEASFYGVMARAADGEVADGSLISELKGLLAKTEGSYPSVAGRIKVEIADQQRKQGNVAEARRSYEDLLEKTGVDEGTQARALLGLGHTYFAEGNPTQTEPYRSALLSFLRVYLETPGAASSTKAEALYHAALSCEKWRGPDSGLMANRLRAYLKRDFANSEWAKL